MTPALLAIAGAIGLLALGRTTASTPQPTGFLPQAAAPFVIGWLAATIAALIVFSGSTFLLAGSLPWGRGLPRGETAMAIGTVLSVLSAMAAGCMLYLARPALRTILGYALAAVSLILAYLLPTFGPCLLIAAVGLLTGQRALAVFAAFGALWSLGSLYYMLHMTLAQKALVISATGVALGAVTFAAGVTLPKRAPAARPVSSGSPLIAAALIALGTAATAGMVGYGIIGNEHIIATGDRLYIRLAPVDPRSLIQGDYMALRFDLPERGRVKDPASRMQAVATLDPQRVAKVLRLEVSPARLAPGEIAIDLKLKSGAWMVASDAWFFREGDGPRFEKARYGEFRLLQNGKVLLVGMADEALQAIR